MSPIFCRVFGWNLYLVGLLTALTLFGFGMQAATGAQNSVPSQPILRSPANDGNDVSRPAMLDVYVSDPNGSSLTVAFYGRAARFTSPGPDFTVIVLPDPQYYNANLNGGTPAIFAAQTQWIADNRMARKIAFVLEVGDSVENGDNSGNPAEWLNASSALSLLQAAGLPYGLAVGNHDQSPTSNPNGTTVFYNQFFGTAHYRDTYFYGGHFETNSDNHFDLFTASGMDFVVVYLEYDPAASLAVLDWANQVLATYSDRRAIVVSHYIIGPGNPGAFGAQGQAIYNALKSNPNLFLMLCGHESTEGRRQDTFNDSTVTSLLANYQYRTNGGDGWLRILQFSPARNQILVQTYSPTLNVFETDNSSQFTIPYDMQDSGANFDVIATIPSVASGSTATTTWDNLAAATEYEWYVTLSNGTTTTVGPRWTFTTATEQTNHPPVATEQAVSVDEDTPRAVTLTGADPDSNTLSYAVVSGPAHGALGGTAPDLTYTPALNYNGHDSFTFKVNDGTLDSAPALVGITINPVNDPPVAGNDSYLTDQDVALTLAVPGVLANDTDPDGDPLTAALATAPGHGTVTLNANGGFTYQPATGYRGNDSFTYTTDDGHGGTTTGAVAITVRAVNQAPVANAQSVTTNEDTAQPITLTGSDPDNDALSYTVVSGPAHGTLSGAAPNLTYAPALNYNGNDSFTFKVSDGTLDSAPTLVSIITNPVNDPPVAASMTISVSLNTPYAGTLTATDFDSVILSYALVAPPRKGSVVVNPDGQFTYRPRSKGGDSFTFQASDGMAISNIARVSITVH